MTLYEKLKEFARINEQFRLVFELSEKSKEKSLEDKEYVLVKYIARDILINPFYFDDVANVFMAELPKLLSLGVQFNNEYEFNFRRHILNCVLLASVIEKRDDLKGYALRYFNEYPSPFALENSVTTSKKRRIKDTINITDLEVVQACYTLLKSNANFYRNKWQWSEFIKRFLQHEDEKIRGLTCRTLGILFGMNESQLEKLLSKKSPSELCIDLSTNIPMEYCPAIDKNPILPSKHLKSNHVIDICGIHIPSVSEPYSTHLLVEVASTKNNLRKIALGLTSDKAICLQGPVGSGKTSLVEYLASRTGRKLGQNFVKIQLGDQTDSKMLLGTYRCTDTPGEFVWQPGVLTQAVIEGNWLLLEDIDTASMDIASVLTSLLENKSLTVPGYRDSVQISPGFQLFLTQRLVTTISGHHKKHSNALSLLEKLLFQINVDPLSPSELEEILTVKYPQFKTISGRMLNVFHLFSRDNDDGGVLKFQKSARLISTRDFFKWCKRAAIDFDVKSQESALKVLQDAIDIFCCSFSNREEALNLAKQISTQLGIINQKAEYFFTNYKPNIQLSTDSLIAGRVSLKRENNMYSKYVNFSFTRPSAVLLERIMCCVHLNEPVLLVGETGTGKTSSVQYLAHTIGQKLVVINMNQQSDSADLLGGFKPVDLKFILEPIRSEFESIFCDFFKVEPNRKYLSNIALCFNNSRWSDLVKLMQKSCVAAINRLTTQMDENNVEKYNKDKIFLQKWKNVNEKISKIELQLKNKNSLAFAFIEGSLVKAVEKGYWVLLDEINLANSETLECLSGLLEGTEGSLCLLERGDKKPIKRHQNFTLFACMNPSTDVGKKDLPAGLRNRFTEFFVDELTEKNDLLLLVNSYLQAMSLKEKELEKIVSFYLKVRNETITSLSDGLGHKPHYSLRSLCRALFIASKNPCGMFKRSLYEAFCLSFLTQLDSNSYKIVERLIKKYMLGDEKSAKGVMKQPIPEPKDEKASFVQFEGYWIKRGGLEVDVPEDYILTESVRKNLKDLVRVVSIGKLPVLLQGDTSVGKTSLITYLARSSGNKCVRINNHEHTDLQEYIGSYVADSTGKLVFREGLLVEAMRKGHWIILDELNLAPTDVLEALNRVLDNNRELFIPETQETVKANENFMLFATQNPPGAYGGRKMLSRAFRNRFVELHFNEIPPNELEFILHKRCQVAPTYAKKMISVMTELQMRRRGSAAFAGKQGFMTLRDLFRWGERYRLARNTDKLYDWDQHLADEGYLVLAGRVRKSEERREISEVLEKHLKRKMCPENLFTLSDKTSTVTKHILEILYKNQDKHSNIVWTYNMRQLAVLVAKAMQFKEPVLLVGETGGGKTTICQILADDNSQELVTVNCHMHTESSDFIGGLRPVRDHSDPDDNRLFEWVDGPLLTAMRDGSVFLADEISLADDSVLERLNSLLEPERCLLLAEKGIDLNNTDNSELVKAHDSFYFIGTMNPGGDFGKKELSPALRNRFTEIWCENCTKREDFVAIIVQNLKEINSNQNGITKDVVANLMMDFIEWFRNTEIGKRFTISIRDILTWVNFINSTKEKIHICALYVHGAYLTFLDSLGSGITSSENLHILQQFLKHCQKFLTNQLLALPLISKEAIPNMNISTITKSDNKFGIEPFFIEIGNENETATHFSFNAPTTVFNTMRLLRGMQLNKAILLEGSPGVGKTSLVTALAKQTCHKIFRINLSDQTDISDLFGADLPVEGGTGGQFSWRDGPLLQALKEGSWILLDELNLASQSVLEGLNACLDHRGEIFIPELGKTFHVKPGTRFFGCQNPLKQGGSRRGLPKSFLNRFIQVNVHSLTDLDYIYILTNQFPNIPQEIIKNMVKFNSEVCLQLESHTFGGRGGPWECNLRDLTRWCEVMIHRFNISKEYEPQRTVQLIYADRMRGVFDKQKILEIFESVFERKVTGDAPVVYVNKEKVFFGDVSVDRIARGVNTNVLKQDETCLVLRTQLGTLRSLAYCVNLNWMSILVGSSGSGKSSIVKTLASLSGKTLKTLPVTSAMDTTDILGGYEQTDYNRHLDALAGKIRNLLFSTLQELLVNEKNEEAVKLLQIWEAYIEIDDSKTVTMDEESKIFLRKLSKLDILLETLLKYDNDNKNPDTISKLQKQTNRLTELINIEGSLNAGGKFEWVDSILVKCLQEGSWLLVDNVNLCSSAVLDRLNGLLEPNGVLTISERGVLENGSMVEIKPHPDFRLFLTMDPKNGEISRAMRNRGIEIFLLNATDTYYSNDFDIKSLIDHEGLSDPNLIQCIQDLHQFISNNCVFSEKPGIAEMLQCSSLIAQQLNFGVDTKEAFFNSFVEVYYKTRNAAEFNSGDFLGEIKEEIRNKIENKNIKVFYSKDVTLETKDVQSASEFSKIKQQGAALDIINKNGGNATLKINLLANFITITSGQDFMNRFFYAKSKYMEYVDILNNLKIELIMRKHNFPLDSRWTPELPYNKNDSNNTTCWSNTVVLLFNYKNIESKIINPNKKEFLSLYDLLKLVKQNKIESNFDHIVSNNYLELEKQFTEFLEEIINQGYYNENLNDENLFNILHLLQWKKYLSNLIETTNVKKLDSLSSYMLKNKLTICFKWFYNNSVEKIMEITSADLKTKFKHILANINSAVNLKFSLLKNVAENYQKNCAILPPFKSREHQQFYETCKEIEEKFDLYSTKNNAISVLNVFKNKNNIRQSLIELKRYEIHCHISGNMDDYSNISSELNDIKQNIVLSKYDLQLIPLIDHYNKLILKKAVSTLKSNLSLKNCFTIPTDLCSLLQMYEETNDNRLIYEIKTLYHAYLDNCPSNRLSKYLLENPEIQSENFEIILNEFSPYVAFFASHILMENDNNGTSLGNFREVKKQHRHLGVMLWRNFYEMCNAEYDNLNLELDIIKRCLVVFKNEIAMFLANTTQSVNTSLGDIENSLKKYKSTSSLLDINCEVDYVVSIISLIEENLILLEEAVQNKKYFCSQLYFLLGYVKVLLTGKIPLIDPLVKKEIKREILGLSIELFENIKLSYELQNELYSNSVETLHPHHRECVKMLDLLNKQANDLEKHVASKERGRIPYKEVYQQITHAMTTIFSTAIIDKISDSLRNINYAIESKQTDSIDTNTFVRIDQVVPNYEHFLKECHEKFTSSYPDIVWPIISASCEFVHGLKSSVAVLKQLAFNGDIKKRFEIYNPNFEIIKLVILPSLYEQQSSYENQIEGYTNNTFKKFVDQMICNNDSSNLAKQENFRLLKCAIQESFNNCFLEAKSYDILNRKSFNNFCRFVDKFVSSWNKQQQEKEKAEKEAESLYKTRTKCETKSEDEEISEEIKEMFPNYHVLDFSDMQEKKLDDTTVADNIKEFSGLISSEDLQYMVALHTILLQNFTKSEWLNPNPSKNISCDFVQPIMEKYKVFKRILDSHLDGFSDEIDKYLVPSLSVLRNVTEKYGERDSLNTQSPVRITKKKDKDFYKDSDVDEVKSCYHIVEELRIRIEELLDEWPDHPTLKTIIMIIQRIYAFPITSPISRFLTGLEILLSKCHEWEQVAHSGVSLSQHSQNLTQQIITWRKLELSVWKDLLTKTMEKLNEPISKWWLYLYNILKQFVLDKNVSETELIEILQTFVTKSSLAEFNGRLELIRAFHCHATYLESTEETKKFISVSWNIYCYFQQFETVILNKIKDLRAPIEKKLKDYVKIVRWKDVNYWAIKETVEKSHKTLHKFIKEFKETMLQPVSPYLVNIPAIENKNVGIWDRPQRQNPKTYHYTLDPDSYIVKHAFSKGDVPPSKLEKDFTEIRKQSKEIIERTTYPTLVQSLDSFVTEIIETSTHLQNLEVNTNLAKDKQKSQAKSILNQKHRALSDLFKSLTKIGLSFRTGIVKSKVRKISDDFTLRPIDLVANFGHIDCSRTDEKILTIWESCEDYYYKSLIRSDVLETALKSPSSDLGPQNLERCKGFAADFVSFAQQQKSELVRFSRKHYYMRYYLKQMNEFCKGKIFWSTEKVNKIREYLKNILIVLYQFNIILNSCPEEESFGDEVIEIPLLESCAQQDRIQFKHDTMWTKTMNIIEDTNMLTKKIFSILKKSKSEIPAVDKDLVLHRFVAAPDIQNDLELIKNSIESLKHIFEGTNLTLSLQWLLNQNFDTKDISISVERKINLNDFNEKLTTTIENIHDKYKDFLDRTLEEVDSNGLQEGHLKNLLVQNLMEDIEMFDMKNLLGLVEDVASSIFNLPPNLYENYQKQLSPSLPILEQLIQLNQYFFTQQVSAYRITCKMASILMNIFIDLVSKGFCIPPELAEEMDDEGISKPSDGLGLGEGQGERDVSDKIESEDQLDDAQPAGQDKEQKEDEDCKEQEKGIEMSEDFESKLQDKEKKEDEDNSDNDSNDSDAEEQMGETGEGAEQKNKEQFGDDEDNEGEDDSDKKEEKGDQGEKQGEEQLGASEDNKQKDDPSEQPDKSSEEEKEKSKKDINEMEEPEYDEEQTDPYHGNQPELPEPEAMDLPDDLQLDEGEEKEEGQEENPFDIDAMKEDAVPEDKDEEQEGGEDKENECDEEKNFSSDDEDIAHKDEENEDIEETNEKDDNKDQKTEESKGEETEEQDDKQDSNETEDGGLDEKESNQDNVQAMETDEAQAADKTQPSQSQMQKSNEPIDDLCQEDNPDKEGVGQSQMEESSSGHTAQANVPQEIRSSKRDRDEDIAKKQKPGESDSQRSLGDINEPVKKKLKTMEARDEDSGDENEEKEDSEMYQHIKEAKEEKTSQVLDAATKEQAEKQTVHSDKKEEEEDVVEPTKELPEEEEEQAMSENQETQISKPEKNSEIKDKKSRAQHPEGDVLEEIQEMEVEGEVIQTSSVERPADTTYHTQFDDIRHLTAQRLTLEETNELRIDVEKQLASWNESPSSVEAEQAWRKISSVTLPLAQDLSEQLRLVLEPTQASRLKGDFRTGRRINMRKVIPYIASQFRKDKIWLRRTKPSKREYQIVLAIDDSSSMADNKSKEMAFESVALISKALTLLESGQLSVLSFGENVEVVHKLTDQFSDKNGVKLLQKFKFDQQKTCVAKLVDFTTEMFEQSQIHSSALIAKLLIIVSDGRGVFSEGEAYVRQAVRRAKLSNIFMVFVIIDNPENKNSVLDIRMPIFKDGKLLGIQTYMDVFPFSFYIILRDLNSLPNVLSDALRQWFEVVTNLDKQ